MIARWTTRSPCKRHCTAIVTAVGATLTGAEARAISAAPTQNPEAYRLYLQGEEYRQRPDALRQELESAGRLYERALLLDSTFALAYASLSNVHGLLYWFGYDPYPSRVELQRRAAEAAIRSAPELPQAHWAMGMVHYWGERDFSRALSELTSAAKALPGSAELWSYVGYLNRRLGNWDAVLEAFAKASALDPRDPLLFSDLGGNTLHFLHRYAEANSVNNRALELAPEAHGARLNRAQIHLVWHGELDSMRSTLEGGPEDYGMLGSADLWRAKMALWQRQPERILALLSPPGTVTFEAQKEYSPGRLCTRAGRISCFTTALQQPTTSHIALIR
jgi:serine/threonine-protein kinase